MTPSKLQTTTALALVLAVASCGGDEECGPGTLSGSTVAATSAQGEIHFASFTSSPNNDCPVMGAPTSLTIEAQQDLPQTPLRATLTLCLPRPDLIDEQPVSLADDSLVQVIDVTQRPSEGCLITLDRSVTPTGSVTFAGFCGDGQGAEGFALSFAGTLGGTLQCDGDGGVVTTPLTFTLEGSAAVDAPR